MADLSVEQDQLRALHELDGAEVPLEVILTRVQRLVDARREWENGPPGGEGQDHFRRWDAFRAAQDDFEAVGVSVAFLFTRLLAENTSLSADRARLRAQIEAGEQLRVAAKELLALKNGPRDAAYRELKPVVWRHLTAALAQASAKGAPGRAEGGT